MTNVTYGRPLIYQLCSCGGLGQVKTTSIEGICCDPLGGVRPWRGAGLLARAQRGGAGCPQGVASPRPSQGLWSDALSPPVGSAACVTHHIP